jgi:hypothetical protein
MSRHHKSGTQEIGKLFTTDRTDHTDHDYRVKAKRRRRRNHEPAFAKAPARQVMGIAESAEDAENLGLRKSGKLFTTDRTDHTDQDIRDPEKVGGEETTNPPAPRLWRDKWIRKRLGRCCVSSNQHPQLHLVRLMTQLTI